MSRRTWITRGAIGAAVTAAAIFTPGWLIGSLWASWFVLRVGRAMTAKPLGRAEIYVGFAAVWGVILAGGISGATDSGGLAEGLLFAGFAALVLCVPAYLTASNLAKWHFNRPEITEGRHVRMVIS